jgi:hypothetical protein
MCTAMNVQLIKNTSSSCAAHYKLLFLLKTSTNALEQVKINFSKKSLK